MASPRRAAVTWLVALAAAVGLAALFAPGCSSPTTLTAPSAPVAAAGVGGQWFEDVTDKVGLTFTHDSGPTGAYFMPQSMVAGCAIFDADGDGRPDLFFIQSAGPNTGKGNQLWLQDAAGKFRDASAGSGLDFDGVNVGVAVGDIDNDGRPDILVTQYTGARLFHNEGGGKFKDITAAAGINNPLWGSSAAFFDYDRDGRLDLVIVNYLDYDRSWPCTAPDGSKDFCGPKTFTGTAARLFHNLGPKPGTPAAFADVTAASGLAAKVGPGLGVYCADLTGDGWPDMFVTNDGMPNHLWVNQKDGTFKDEAFSRGLALTGMGVSYANMGIAAGDYDGDGLIDLFVTHLSSETHTLWRQHPAGLFKDQTQAAGAAKTKWRGTGFGSVAADFDLDGRPDIAFVNGRVYVGPPPAAGADDVPPFWRPYTERNQLMRNVGGKFEDVSDANPAFCSVPNVGRGLAVGDIDGDGRPDLLVMATAGRARLYRNVTTANHWLAVRATDPSRGGRDLYGTTVKLTAGGRTQVQSVQPGHSYLSSSTPELLFGLGDAAFVDRLDVTWPDGKTETFPGGPAGRRLTLTPGGGKSS